MQAPNRETFKQLMFAAFNVADHVEPGSGYGLNYTKAMIKTADLLYDLMEGKQPGTVNGVLQAVRLLAETTCASDSEAYAQMEIQRGMTNELRHEERGATIQLPALVN